ncbi:MAG: tryptophan synthase subunit alpha [Longimicrobiaceae bacterium]
MSATTSSDRGGAARAFAAARAQGRAALVPYVTAGHPSPGDTAAVLEMLAAEGADLIELGVPFSDPLADGPTIQRSSFLAIEQGVDLPWTLQALADFRRAHDTPVVLFTYLNPVLHHGLQRFLADAAAAGADGVLLTDLPVGAAPELERQFEESGLDLIRLVAPTTTPERAREIARAARGFLYYVSRTGVTGAREALSAGLEREVAALRAATDVPVAVGFGISTAEQAAFVGGIADGVVVGSALVDRLDREGVEGGRALMRELRRALEGGAGG